VHCVREGVGHCRFGQANCKPVLGLRPAESQTSTGFARRWQIREQRRGRGVPSAVRAPSNVSVRTGLGAQKPSPMNVSVELLLVGARLAGGVTDVSARQLRSAQLVVTTNGRNAVPEVARAS
jgi:hypothetical protein